MNNPPPQHHPTPQNFSRSVFVCGPLTVVLLRAELAGGEKSERFVSLVSLEEYQNVCTLSMKEERERLLR